MKQQKAANAFNRRALAGFQSGSQLFIYKTSTHNYGDDVAESLHLSTEDACTVIFAFSYDATIKGDKEYWLLQHLLHYLPDVYGSKDSHRERCKKELEAVIEIHSWQNFVALATANNIKAE